MSSPRKRRVLDIRPLIMEGEQPFPRIAAATSALTADEVLHLITPFLPSPLIERLQSEGFEARPERRADGSWETRFWRSPGP